MNKQRIEKVLREYKTKKSIVDTTNARIQAYTEAINNPEIIKTWSYTINNRELGMPGSPNRNTSSPVEKEVCSTMLTVDLIKEWISEDKSRIYIYNLQINIIECALKALTEQERYIIILKYFERMSWTNIELSFNKEFRQKNDITSGQVKNINEQAINGLLEILQPLENTFS